MKRILIVEDDKKIAKALNIRFIAHGYEVVTAFDAVMATTTARDYEPDLILMDITIPGGDGFSLANNFKDIDNTAGVPVVFITASRKEGLRKRAMEVGGAEFFEKPIDSQRLLTAVSQLV